MNILSAASTFFDGATSAMKNLLTPKQTVMTIGGSSITATQLEAATGSLGTFFTTLSQAIAAKNYNQATELSIEEAAKVAADLGLPYAGLIADALPFAFGVANGVPVKPQSKPGANPTYDSLWPSANSPDQNTNGGWPTANQP